ncbi:MAG: SGNH/GDSL hydrolase family protein [Fuerstiella sp.]
MPKPVFDRRQLLQSTAIAAGVTAAMKAAPACIANPTVSSLKEGDVVLFQGDSITDAGRDRKGEANPNNARTLGNGYPVLIASELLNEYAALKLKVYNRGISGHKVPDLDKRWKKDCIDLKPAVVSILVGVNDIWHKMNGRYDGTVETYKTGLTALVKKTIEALPDTTLVICEPFALRCGAVKDSWYPEFDERRAVAKDVAQAADAIWVPFQTMFDEAIAAGTEAKYWAGDGVHPTLAGHALMAQTWRKVVGV